MVTLKFVLVAFVKIPVDATDAPIGLLSTEPPDMVSPATTMASVILLLGSVSAPVSTKLVRLSEVIVELVIVVVANVVVAENIFKPVKVWLLARYAIVVDPVSWFTFKPLIVAPVKLTVDVTVRRPMVVDAPVAKSQANPPLKVLRAVQVLVLVVETPPPPVPHPVQLPTVSVVMFALLMVVLEMVVVAKVVVALNMLSPVNVWFEANLARVAASERFAVERPLITAPVTLSVEVTVKFPIVDEGAVSAPVMVSPVVFTKRESYAEPSW